MTDSISFLAPFQYEFMIRAMIVGALVGTVCATLSCFLILKGWSLMGDAISHAVLPGIVIAYVVGVPLALGAFCSGLFCASATGYIKENSRIKEDAVMGIVFTGLFALGLILVSKVEADIHLMHVLFGSLLGISESDVIQTSIVAGVTLLVVVLMRKDLLLYCFDANHARSIGHNVRVLHYVLLSLLAATIVASLQAVGIIMVIALLITPGAIAYLLSDRFGVMIWIAIGSAVFSCLAGVYVSFFINGSTSGCIVLMLGIIFVLAMIFAPKHGLIVRGRWRKSHVKPWSDQENAAKPT